MREKTVDCVFFGLPKIAHFQRAQSEQEDAHRDHIGRQPVVFLQWHLPVVRHRKFGTYTEKIGGRRRRGDRARLRPLGKHHGKKSGTCRKETLIHRTSEKAAFARTVEVGQLRMHQCICYGWKQFHSFMQRTLRAKEFSKFKITSST